MNKNEMTKKLKGYIYGEFGSAKSYAEEKMITPAYVSQILRGDKPPTKDMLSDIGLVKKVTTTYIQA